MRLHEKNTGIIKIQGWYAEHVEKPCDENLASTDNTRNTFQELRAFLKSQVLEKTEEKIQRKSSANKRSAFKTSKLLTKILVSFKADRKSGDNT